MARLAQNAVLGVCPLWQTGERNSITFARILRMDGTIHALEYAMVGADCLVNG